MLNKFGFLSLLPILQQICVGGEKKISILFYSIFSTGNGFQAENQKKTMTALENVHKLLEFI